MHWMRMRNSNSSQNLSCRKLGGAAAILMMLGLPVSAQTRSRPQNSNQTANGAISQVTCASDDGQRKYCNADTRGGVLISRQLSRQACQAGSTWGFDGNGIWVDKGCSAEFSVKQYAYGTPDTQKTVANGASISVRVDQTIDAKSNDGRVYSGVVSEYVLGQDGKVAIPQGSTAELMFKADSQKNLQLDLESLTINGQRYAVNVDPNNVTATGKDGLGANGRTAKYVGTGAAIGAIIGAIAGGGKGAAIGAGVGAGAGAGTQVLTRGKEVKIPAETVVTFRLNQALYLGIADNGYTRGRDHYHYPTSIFDNQ